MSFTIFTRKHYSFFGAIIILLFLSLGTRSHVFAANVFQINGYYLGATPEELGVTVESDLNLEEKFYEAEENGVRLYFVRVQDRLHVYRIVKEEPVNQNTIKSVLDKLKAQYGTPDRQQIKTSSVRPQNKMEFRTTVKNRAVWNISESEEFITEVESNRIVYELIDHDPEQIKGINKPDAIGEGEFSADGWDPDY